MIDPNDQKASDDFSNDNLYIQFGVILSDTGFKIKMSLYPGEGLMVNPGRCRISSALEFLSYHGRINRS